MTQDVGSDPTVGLPDFCTYCGEPITCPFCSKVHSNINSLCNDLLEKIMISEGDLLEELMLFEEDSMDVEATEDEGGETEDQPVQLQALLEIQHT